MNAVIIPRTAVANQIIYQTHHFSGRETSQFDTHTLKNRVHHASMWLIRRKHMLALPGTLGFSKIQELISGTIQRLTVHEVTNGYRTNLSSSFESMADFFQRDTQNNYWNGQLLLNILNKWNLRPGPMRDPGGQRTCFGGSGSCCSQYTGRTCSTQYLLLAAGRISHTNQPTTNPKRGDSPRHMTSLWRSQGGCSSRLILCAIDVRALLTREKSYVHSHRWRFLVEVTSDAFWWQLWERRQTKPNLVYSESLAAKETLFLVLKGPNNHFHSSEPSS